MKNDTTRKPVLIVQHAPYEHPAVIRRALESQGTQTLTIHPYRSEIFPRHKEISGMISLGGSMHANDDETQSVDSARSASCFVHAFWKTCRLSESVSAAK